MNMHGTSVLMSCVSFPRLTSAFDEYIHARCCMHIGLLPMLLMIRMMITCDAICDAMRRQVSNST